MIKAVNISEELYIQQLIYRRRTNPEPREKLRLITVSNIHEENQVLRLLLVTFDVNLVVLGIL